MLLAISGHTPVTSGPPGRAASGYAFLTRRDAEYLQREVVPYAHPLPIERRWCNVPDLEGLRDGSMGVDWAEMPGAPPACLVWPAPRSDLSSAEPGRFRPSLVQARTRHGWIAMAKNKAVDRLRLGIS